ncbi:MAG: heparinase II/III family protein, partial [Pyrinomonas methylaliphatogenes]|nr:heparinase II/III family protein [Pyrinomonas methylaliphatogenes]
LRRGEDHQRTHPGGHLLSNYNLLYATAARFRDGEAQGVAEWLRKLGQLNAEDFWSLIWYDPTVQPVPIEKQARWHYFTDHEVIYWRSGWSKEAVAFAFKCGPPEGHHAAELLKRFSDWHLSSGHAHPDAGSFIIYAKGRYLTGDSGYAGVPLTAHHNTALVDGRGQAREGRGHDAFSGVPYDLLNRIRILEAKLGDKEVVIRADVTSAYMPELDLLRFEREFRFSAEGGFRIIDTLQLAKAHVITELIHADETIMPLGDDRFAIGGSDAKLIVSVEEPKTVRFRIEPNIVIAAGLPGSVDKGERQERGQRLAISSAGPVRDIRFALSLKL